MDRRIGNKFALGLTTNGRPPAYKKAADMEEKIIEYFNSIYTPDGMLIERPTVTGLTLYLGFADKKSLRDYREKKDFAPLIKRALTAVEHSYELMLESKSSTGAIFALKNMGWEDKQEIKQHNTFEELTENQLDTRIERLIKYRANKPTQ